MLIFYVETNQLGKLFSTYTLTYAAFGSHLHDKKMELKEMVGDFCPPDLVTVVC